MTDRIAIDGMEMGSFTTPEAPDGLFSWDFLGNHAQKRHYIAIYYEIFFWFLLTMINSDNWPQDHAVNWQLMVSPR